MSEYKLLPHDAIIEVPESVAVCPYCKAKLTVQLDEWIQNDDGTYSAGDTPHTECTNEPEFPSDDFDEDAWCEFDEFDASHSVMPYVYLLPIQLKVGKWLNENYRFDMGKQSR